MIVVLYAEFTILNEKLRPVFKVSEMAFNFSCP
jgi:hypothetical protein